MIQLMEQEDFDEIYEMIVSSFPEHENRGYEKQKELLCNPKFHIYVMKADDTNQIKGFISIWDIEDYAFIDHFAVSSKIRNEGIGSKILKELSTSINKNVFLEVDIPETDIARRRIQFYERNGYYLNPFHYELPALFKGGHPVELMIMSSDALLTEAKFMSLTKELLEVAYGVKE